MNDEDEPVTTLTRDALFPDVLPAPSRWISVATAADAIHERPEDVQLQLRTLLERFGPELDPVEDLEAWALRQLLRSLVK
ncbi:MAG: hypothetical protein DI536_00955 [Archangium gephyra]|uniref:Uncharacterized protein n=1 Tax=Archangium gephyra TaxID=48 RepID=A0A2W5W5K9_9BACT|nr:MAG: hypothetical protein DI536_00955 [Archangium gephyra]